jgi:hypothetical protein
VSYVDAEVVWLRCHVRMSSGRVGNRRRRRVRKTRAVLAERAIPPAGHAGQATTHSTGRSDVSDLVVAAGPR